ncbi:unnamed protein product (macronuclear) [Paramecium tetraurelia]|uniref:Transmembrane protein n=1 Tax=Paramecium tetraurelia TaxID=5888 RepID=A0C9Z6_PARTE|nr:uncharacterized protein GSPATT00006920001 [Paramecium tetraurelia]CAK67613.1 unnamed protein product [Paramecium tetraurelia]|eukprot:XP_001435010.1 hypothetical protein (macronuclear) [Paramecium tetraurelia strain d4-2]
MFIFVYILFIRACQVINEDYYLYPTKEETLEIPMLNFFQGNDLIYKCSNCPQDVKIVGTMNHRNNIENNYTFKSVSPSTDQIFALTTEPSLNIYLKINGSLILQKVININSNLSCFSVTYLTVNNIILDCYQNETLILYNLKNTTLIQIYTSNSSLPNQTKLGSIINNTTVYFIYGQFFSLLDQNELKLTILYEIKKNTLISTDSLTILAYNFVVSQRESTSQTIFIQQLNEILTYVISQSGTLVQGNNILLYQDIFYMGYYYSYDEYYQFDRIMLIVLDDDQDYMYLVDIFYSVSGYVKLLESKQFLKKVSRNAQIFMNQQFIVLHYNNHRISILQNQGFNKIIIRNFDLHNNNTVVYFEGSTQELLIFGDHIEIYTLQIPTLYFASNEMSGSFSIQAFEIEGNFQIRKCQTVIHYLQVSKIDSSVYQIFVQPQLSFFNLLQFPFIYWITFVSGSLLNVSNMVSNPSLGSFSDSTLQKLHQSLDLTQSYEMNATTINLIVFFIVAINNQTLDLYQEGTILPVSSTDITKKNGSVTQIEITFAILNQQLYFLVCLGIGQNMIQIYEYDRQLSLVNITTFQTQSFKQFQLLSNALVLLLDTNQIVITTFDNQFFILLDSKIFNQIVGSKIDFNPISIFINQQYQSRILYINNQNSFIIGQITERFNFMLISIKKVFFLIQNLQVVNNQLILSYIQQDMSVVQFEVWNVKKLKEPYFQRSMRSLVLELNKDSIFFYSDNQFFYVQIGLIMHIFNPTLSEHSSLYYRIYIDGLQFASTATDSMSLLYFNQSLFLLSPILLQTFYNFSIYSDFLSEQIFNFTISSQLNQQSKINSLNNSVTIINNYEQIQMNHTQVNVSQSQSYIEIFRNNISVEGQILQFKMVNKNKNQDNYTLTNYIQYFNLTYDQANYNLITQLDNSWNIQFLLMNNYSILNYTNKDKYFFGPYKKCIASTAYKFSLFAL